MLILDRPAEAFTRLSPRALGWLTSETARMNLDPRMPAEAWRAALGSRQLSLWDVLLTIESPFGGLRTAAFCEQWPIVLSIDPVFYSLHRSATECPQGQPAVPIGVASLTPAGMKEC